MMKISIVALYLLANTCAPNAPVDVIAGIVEVESGGRIFAINTNYGAKRPRQPKTAAAAIATATALLKRRVNFDAGLAQINSKNFKRLGLTPRNVFNPCVNLQAAQAVYLGNQARALVKGNSFNRSHIKALSAYNTGSFIRGIKNGYAAKVAKSQAKHRKRVLEVLSTFSNY